MRISLLSSEHGNFVTSNKTEPSLDGQKLSLDEPKKGPGGFHPQLYSKKRPCKQVVSVQAV